MGNDINNAGVLFGNIGSGDWTDADPGNVFGGTSLDFQDPTAPTTNTTYTTSPEARKILNAVTPAISTIANAITSGQTLYDVPSAVTPTQGWYDNLSSEVKQGVWEPYNEGAEQLKESLGGSVGSARGGYSGAAGAALGEYYENAATDVGLQTWNMTSPGLYQEYEAQVGAQQAPYSTLGSILGGTSSYTPTGVTTTSKK